MKTLLIFLKPSILFILIVQLTISVPVNSKIENNKHRESITINANNTSLKSFTKILKTLVSSELVVEKQFESQIVSVNLNRVPSGELLSRISQVSNISFLEYNNKLLVTISTKTKAHKRN